MKEKDSIKIFEISDIYFQDDEMHQSMFRVLVGGKAGQSSRFQQNA